MDKVCDQCSQYPPLTKIENFYTKILLSQQDDHEECVKVLLEAGADVNAENSYKGTDSGTALVQAARQGHVKRLQALITAGADVNKHYSVSVFAIDMNCRNALTDAIARGNIECVKLLIKAGASVNKVGNKEALVLPFAIKKDNVICADLLIKAGASVNGGHNYSPLCHAITTKAHRCLDLLLRSGADVHDTGTEELTALMLVRDEECRRLLLKHHSQINRRNCFGQNALTFHMSIATSINREICSLLFAAGETTPEKVKRILIPIGTVIRTVNVADYLPQIQTKLNLKHLCREAIRKHLLKLDLHTHLFYRFPRLGLPSLLVEYLLYDMSLDAPGEDKDSNDNYTSSDNIDDIHPDGIKEIVDDEAK